MKNSFFFLSVSFFIIIISGNINAQQSTNESWNKIISLHFGFPMGTNNWEYTHPSYSGSGAVQTIREPGTFEGKYTLYGEFELSKGYFGFSAGAGIFPAVIKVDNTNETYNFNSIFIEITGMIFPLGNQFAKIVPLLKIGAGGIKSSGDLDNTALFISFGGEVRTFFTENFGASLMLKGRYMTYDEIPLDENITGDISFTNFAVELGFMYLF